jgi:hypothetical protein
MIFSNSAEKQFSGVGATAQSQTNTQSKQLNLLALRLLDAVILWLDKLVTQSIIDYYQIPKRAKQSRISLKIKETLANLEARVQFKKILTLLVIYIGLKLARTIFRVFRWSKRRHDKQLQLASPMAS